MRLQAELESFPRYCPNWCVNFSDAVNNTVILDSSAVPTPHFYWIIDNGTYQDSRGNGEFTISKTAGELGSRHEGLLNEAEAAAAAEERETHSFEIDPSQVIWFSEF